MLLLTGCFLVRAVYCYDDRKVSINVCANTVEGCIISDVFHLSIQSMKRHTYKRFITMYE